MKIEIDNVKTAGDPAVQVWDGSALELKGYGINGDHTTTIVAEGKGGGQVRIVLSASEARRLSDALSEVAARLGS